MQLDIDISKRLRSGKRIFDLQVRFASSSQRIVLFGPSGAGKSLTLKAIAGLIQPDSGRIRLGETTVFNSEARINLAPQARKIAYLFQDYALFPHLTVRQNIGFGLVPGWFNPHPDKKHAAVDYWLDTFHLSHLAHQLPGELSGGQRQRTALARALASQPKALLLDEPFAALDPALRIEMRKELDELQRRLQVPMILITHDEDDAALFGEHVLHLREGVIDNGP
ncbi:MAG: ATP-binding cassette domain-containing protein [Pseudomonadota bacterium]